MVTRFWCAAIASVALGVAFAHVGNVGQAKADCKSILAMGLTKWMDQEAERDPSTAGTVQALSSYSGCLVEDGERMLKTAKPSRAKLVNEVRPIMNELLTSQWLIHGCQGGTMFQIFIAGDAVATSELFQKMADPKMQSGKAIPKSLAIDESRYLTKASDKIRAYLPLVDSIVKSDDYDAEAKEIAKRSLTNLIECWEKLQSMAGKLAGVDRLRIYKVLDTRLEPNWSE